MAVIVRTSTSVRSCLSFSLWVTPKRCSSSITSSPKSLKITSPEIRRCVPMTISTVPCASRKRILLCCWGVRKRESISTITGKAANRSRKVLKCCWAKTVVGTSIATCLPSITALKAARRAISVLPKPTSPQIRRSIGRWVSISVLTAASEFN